jgi:hypothetical protein
MFQIVECTLEMLRERCLRADSIRNRKWDAIHGIIENTTRTLRKAARRSSLLGAAKKGSPKICRSPKLSPCQSYDIGERILQKEGAALSSRSTTAKPKFEGALTA